MSDHDMPAGIHRFSHHIIVVALQVEAELYQQRSAGKAYTIPPHHSSKRRCVGRKYFLAQPKLGQIRPPPGGGGELVEGPSLAPQLAVHVRGGGQVGKKQVRRGDDGSDTLAVESGQRLQRLGHGTGAVIHAGDQMAV